ncbi:hypothetical protein D9C73_006083 [Collichthys lucidus]|uniref:Ig-like domain-containing protein n=1 Tax=Collichthys lucidus TaxID=240159 RepID=A0A4U5UDC1_COLLU|nr:hypothetical protein D9C73_006083 [Collichthys lucidus]
MFPPLVQFSWKRQKEDGPLVEVHRGDGEQLELRESGRTVSILLIHQQENSTYKYGCYVKHEGGTVEAQIKQGNEGLVTVFSSDSTSCGDTVKESCFLLQRFQLQQPPVLQMLIVKSLVYCCGLSLLMILRNKGASTNCTHAD